MYYDVQAAHLQAYVHVHVHVQYMYMLHVVFTCTLLHNMYIVLAILWVIKFSAANIQIFASVKLLHKYNKTITTYQIYQIS